MTKRLLLVCDDAGFASVDRGIRAFAEATGKPVCAEYLITQPGASDRARDMADVPNVSIGIHFELAGVSDADRIALAKDLRVRGTTLGEQADVRSKATDDAREQLRFFRETLGRNPAHVSTHGDFHLDASGAVMPWWTDLMEELFDGTVPPMQWAHPIVRHNMYSWNLTGNKRKPRTAHEFEAELRAQQSDIVEFVSHPAIREPGDESIAMLFNEEMRLADLTAAIHVVKSGCIERAGFDIVAAGALRS